eukprot:GCRY01008007.1.p1 GENE.GCRY01008007.1~~GCRY01008007.1.p1  ORF type:complete len:112 (+),score=10.75 GCRY01008007.1:166-501(+)
MQSAILDAVGGEKKGWLDRTHLLIFFSFFILCCELLFFLLSLPLFEFDRCIFLLVESSLRFFRFSSILLNSLIYFSAFVGIMVCFAAVFFNCVFVILFVSLFCFSACGVWF